MIFPKQTMIILNNRGGYWKARSIKKERPVRPQMWIDHDRHLFQQRSDSAAVERAQVGLPRTRRVLLRRALGPRLAENSLA